MGEGIIKTLGKNITLTKAEGKQYPFPFNIKDAGKDIKWGKGK